MPLPETASSEPILTTRRDSIAVVVLNNPARLNALTAAMELFHNLILGFSVALTLQNLWFCFVGCFLGTLIGVLPGIGPLATIAMSGLSVALKK